MKSVDDVQTQGFDRVQVVPHGEGQVHEVIEVDRVTLGPFERYLERLWNA